MFSKFLIVCSGADNTILKGCTIKERNKFVGIGSTLILTAVLASLSGGYAIFSTFQSIPVAVAMGIFWGIVIFSLDRYIVTSIDKKGSWMAQVLTALPRIIMAIVLAITISKPIELRLFQNAVAKKMGEISNASITACENEWNLKRDALAKRKSELEDERRTKTEAIYNQDGIYKTLVSDQTRLSGLNILNSKKIAQNERVVAKGTSYPIVGYREDGSPIRQRRRTAIARAALKDISALRSEIAKNVKESGAIEGQKLERKQVLQKQVGTTEDQYSRQIAGVQQQIDDHNSNRSPFIGDCKEKAENAKDIPAQLLALSKLTAENSSVAQASLFITLLFIILETAPVLVKLLSSKGSYEEILETREYALSMEEKVKISNLNGEINTLLKVSSENNRLKLEAELKGNEALLSQIALAQAEIARLSIEKWKQEEIEKLSIADPKVVDPLPANKNDLSALAAFPNEN